MVATGTAFAADSVRTPHVTLQLESERPSITPGETLWLGLHFALEPHWHVYWRNPGDSGEAPKVNWQLPEGWQAGEIHWPVPQRIPVGSLVNYGYEDHVTLLVPIQVPSTVPTTDTVHIGADMTWLVCRELCIPERGSLDLTLGISQTPVDATPAVASRFDKARGQWPVTLDKVANYQATDSITLKFSNLEWLPYQIDDVWFAANAWGPIAPSGKQTWQLDNGDLLITAPPGDLPPSGDDTLHGLLVVSERIGSERITRGFEIAANPAEIMVNAPDMTFLLALVFAFAGGLLLNLMPCVLPVLAIKALGLVTHTDDQRARHGFTFLAGVLLTFATLAGLLIALRAGGDALGWGFQLQQPLVVIGLMYLMLAVALNLSGVYQIGGRLAGFGQSAASQSGLRGTFATGVLAVVVASPCTAPFMGGALGFALTRPPYESLAVFIALGTGFALPVLLLSIFPAWARFLPAPGAWMETLRNALAFPMYGAAAWLLWVLSQQVDATGLALSLTGALLLAFALWWLGQTGNATRTNRIAVTIGLLLSVALATQAGRQDDAAVTILEAEQWSRERVADLRADGQPVFVNFTAAWCITCKVNEQVALSTDAVRAAFSARDITYLKADWTRQDPNITRELQRYGRSGVPLYLLYPANGGEPQVLPQLLTEGLVLAAIDQTSPQEYER